MVKMDVVNFLKCSVTLGFDHKLSSLALELCTVWLS